jgi:hypothetical protein
MTPFLRLYGVGQRRRWAVAAQNDPGRMLFLFRERDALMSICPDVFSREMGKPKTVLT